MNTSIFFYGLSALAVITYFFNEASGLREKWLPDSIDEKTIMALPRKKLYLVAGSILLTYYVAAFPFIEFARYVLSHKYNISSIARMLLDY